MNDRILYIDDEEINLFIFAQLFKSHFEVATASSGEEALELLRTSNEPFSAVISDLSMPKMDGFELLDVVKEEFPSLKRFLLTAFSTDEKIEGAINSGLIIKYFKKPVQVVEVTAAIKSVL